MLRIVGFAIIALLLFSAAVTRADDTECVVLLHGLNRTDTAMRPLQKALQETGYRVVNQHYPSRQKPVQELLGYVDTAIQGCEDSERVHFVTHSMGGILVRAYLKYYPLQKPGRVVMLGPPNKGSEIVDVFGKYAWFEAINGPAGSQLGTAPYDIAAQLGPVDYEVGVIAGDRSINPLLSQILPKPNDGKVSVASTKVAGMKDHLVLPVTHTFMMRDREVIKQVLHFLAEGAFAVSSD